MILRDVEALLIPRDATLREAAERVDANRLGIALVTTPDRKLIGTVTDGDLRRAMLANMDLEAPVEVLLQRQRELDERRPFPLTAPAGSAAEELVSLMRRHDVRQIPLVDAAGAVSSVALLTDLVHDGSQPLHAIVMAGGFGKRLEELTDQLPKPMLPVGDRPLLERIIEQLRDAGISRVNLTTHYRADAIVSHFGDGSGFGIDITYVQEDQPLGTAGALGLVDVDDPILIMNGDILTGVDFRAMHHFHDEHAADMTIAVRPYEVRVPYGLADLDGSLVTGLDEKPLLRGFVNAGIYLMNPDVRRLVEPGEPLEMPDLIRRALDRGRTVVGFPLREYWLDIGQRADYEQALEDVARLEP
jgi:dTDP-glucose pyrophosphorylase